MINSYRCSCPIGFAGPRCEKIVDDCNYDNPCLNGGTCKNSFGSYVCDCRPGFTGHRCELKNDCGLHNPCVHGDCLGGPNSFQCDCHPGYAGYLCDRPINECLANPCQNRGVCVDRPDGYKCRCLPGTWGKNCEHNNNDCIDNPCINGECVDGINSYQVRLWKFQHEFPITIQEMVNNDFISFALFLPEIKLMTFLKSMQRIFVKNNVSGVFIFFHFYLVDIFLNVNKLCFSSTLYNSIFKS